MTLLSEPSSTMAGRRSPITRTLLEWRTSPGLGWIEIGLLFIYGSVLTLGIHFHEPWADEAQAWQIARLNTVWQIFRYRLHYEGSPGLWHLILHVFQQLGGHYGAINWLGASFAIAGIVVFLRWSPFPLLIRVLVPLTFFLQYQYAVIARGYDLFPLLAFSLCALFCSRRNPLWFALCAGLLANISLQGTVCSFFMLCLYVHDRLLLRRPKGHLVPLKDLLRPLGVYLALLLIAGLTAVPAPDTGFASVSATSGGFVRNLLHYYPGILPQTERLPPPPKYVLTTPDPALPLPPLPPPFLPFPPRPEPSLLHSPGDWASWYIHQDHFDARGHALPVSFTRPLLETAIELVTLATAPVSTSKLLACAFLGVLLLWLWLRRSLRLLLPWVANILVGEALWVADHHTGMFFISLLMAIWLAIQTPPATRRKTVPTLDTVLVVTLALVCAVQIAWTAVSIRHDIYGTYDPGRQTATYLLEHPHKRMASFDFVAVSVQPFFEHNPFFNLQRGYWVWGADDNANGAHLTTIEQHPDLVLFSEDLLAPGFSHNDWAPLSPDAVKTMDRDLTGNPIIQDLKAHGYRETHRFCGDRYFRFTSSYRACYLLFEPEPVS